MQNEEIAEALGKLIKKEIIHLIDIGYKGDIEKEARRRVAEDFKKIITWLEPNDESGSEHGCK